MIDERKARRISIFEDTLDFISEEEDLYNKVESSKRDTEFIPADEYYELDAPNRDGKIKVSKDRTFESAMRYAFSDDFGDKKIAVLNFASATNPGGGVEDGSSAQEESLCRCSTLYPVLEQQRLRNDFYEPHRRARNPLNNDDIIYSPEIVIIKTDEEYPERMEMDDWCVVDVITCAAPNLRKRMNKYSNGREVKQVSVTPEELYDLQYNRAQHILNVAAGNGVEVLILGAFGCGAFENDPAVVSRAWKDALDEYARHFDVVEFAIYTSAYDQKNYKAFASVFEEED
ncbi:MAG: TIGR02452 family protein [Bacteroidales bacterium]|nr:TIGR02452 family protein [Bacteroidales bacterium]